MEEFADPAPIASSEQFKKALLAFRDDMNETQLELLRAHCLALEHTITATKLADATGLKSSSAANLQYGKLARVIADHLRYQPDKRPDGTERWWRALAYGKAGAKETKDGQFEWIMRPELVAALSEMKWVKAQS